MKRVPSHAFDDFLKSTAMLLNAASGAVRKLDSGKTSDDLSDLELLGVCSVAQPQLLTQEDAKGAAASSNIGTLMGMVEVREGALSNTAVRVSTSRPIEVVLVGKEVVLRT